MDDPFTTDVEVRYRDLDAEDIVNHAVFVTYLEVARGAYIEDAIGIPEDEHSFVVASLSVDYERSITLADDAVTVALEVRELGTSSVTVDYELRVEDGLAAVAETTLVHLDPDDDVPAPLPEDLRERIEAYEAT